MTTVNYILFVILAFLMGYTLCMATEVQKWVKIVQQISKGALECIDHMETIISRLCDEDVTQEEKDRAKKLAVRSQMARLVAEKGLKKV